MLIYDWEFLIQIHHIFSLVASGIVIVEITRF